MKRISFNQCVMPPVSKFRSVNNSILGEVDIIFRGEGHGLVVFDWLCEKSLYTIHVFKSVVVLVLS